MVSLILVLTASGVGFCIGYSAALLNTLLKDTGLDHAYADAPVSPRAGVLAIELRTGRVLQQGPFETFSFAGAMPVGSLLMAPSFDLFDERFSLPARPAGISIYEFRDPGGG